MYIYIYTCIYIHIYVYIYIYMHSSAKTSPNGRCGTGLNLALSNVSQQRRFFACFGGGLGVVEGKQLEVVGSWKTTVKDSTFFGHFFYFLQQSLQVFGGEGSSFFGWKVEFDSKSNSCV